MSKKYGLRPLPTASYPQTSGNDGAVTLTTHRLEEFYAFTGKMFTYDATDRLNQICRHVPVHLVYGGRNDMLYVLLDTQMLQAQTEPDFEARGRFKIHFPM